MRLETAQWHRRSRSHSFTISGGEPLLRPRSLKLCCGQLVHDRRVELGFTQTELADRAGMTQPQLSRLESGGATPTVPLLARLAAALNADLDIAFRPHNRVAA